MFRKLVFASLRAKVLGKGKGKGVLILLFNHMRENQASERTHKGNSMKHYYGIWAHQLFPGFTADF